MRWLNVAMIIALIFFGKFSGFLKDIVFTYSHGVSHVSDAFFLANSVSALLYIGIYSAIPLFFVPRYRGYSEQASYSLLPVLLFFLGISSFLSLCVLIWAENIVSIVAKSGVDQVLTSKYLRIMSVSYVLSTVVSFYNSRQSCGGSVVPFYLTPVLNNISFCIFLLLFPSNDCFYLVLWSGVFVWAMLVLINALITKISLRYDLAAVFSFLFDGRNYIAFFAIAFSLYIEQVNTYVGVYFSSGLGGGELSVYTYASKLNLLASSIFLATLTISIFPKISEDYVSKGLKVVSNSITEGVARIVMLTAPVIAVAWVASRELIELIFMRGKFGMGDVIQVSLVLPYALAVLPLMLLRDFLSRACFATGNGRLPFVAAITAFCVNALLCYFFANSFGLKAIYVCSSISLGIGCGICFLFLQRVTSTFMVGRVCYDIFVCSLFALLAFLISQCVRGGASYWGVKVLLLVFVYFSLLWIFQFKAFRMLIEEFCMLVKADRR